MIAKLSSAHPLSLHLEGLDRRIMVSRPAWNTLRDPVSKEKMVSRVLKHSCCQVLGLVQLNPHLTMALVSEAAAESLLLCPLLAGKLCLCGDQGRDRK